MASTQSPPRPQKRDHDAFEGINSSNLSVDQTNSLYPHTMREDSSDLSDVGPNTPSDMANSPMIAATAGTSSTASPSAMPPSSAFTALNGNPPPPAKKTKLTFAEKEEMRLLKEAEKAKRAQRAAEKEAEKEAERKVKEAERKIKEAEMEKKRAATTEKKRKQDEEKKKKEDKKKKLEEEKQKKERSQKKLSNFFAIPRTPNRRGSMDSGGRTSMSPAPQTSNPSLLAEGASPAATTPRKPVLSHYEKTFPEFFIHADVKVAKVNRSERDEEGIVSTQNAIDGYLSGERSPGSTRPFDATSLFHLPCSNIRRGNLPMPVRNIMTDFSGASSQVIDLTTDSQNSQIKRMRELLRKVPVKFIMHAEDVRPPYRGTYTGRPVNGMAKLARNPWRRELPDKNYDYDSEGEWVEDEDAEDCMSDGEEDEDTEDGEDMEGFLDDENDELANGRRTTTHGNNDLEPISTGLCWEDKHKRSTNVKMMPYRMEIILDSKLKSIDPFSTSYWPSTVPTAMDPPRAPLMAKKTTNVNNILLPQASASSKSIKTLSLNPPPPSTKGKDSSNGPKILLDAKDIPAFLAAVKDSNLTKVGIIEVLKKQFPAWKAPAIKGTLETLCKRVGVKNTDKRWVVVEGGGVGGM